jgi:hypothetical protein
LAGRCLPGEKPWRDIWPKKINLFPLVVRDHKNRLKLIVPGHFGDRLHLASFATLNLEGILPRRNVGNVRVKLYGIIRSCPSDSSFVPVQVDSTGQVKTHPITTYSLGALPMFVPNETDGSSFPNVRLIEQAFKTLKQSVVAHVDHESRLQRLCLGWQQKWMSQCEELRIRIENLEARLAPWITEQREGPRLAVVSRNDEAA